MTTEERLNSLERANKHWRIAVVALGVVVILIAWQKQLPDTIHVRRLVVVNGQAKPIVELAENSSGESQIRILGGLECPSGEKLSSGKQVVAASIEPSKLLVANSKGGPLVQLASDDEHGHGSIELVNVKRDETMVRIGADPGNNGVIQTLAAGGRKLVVIGTSPEGAGLVSTHDPAGKVNAQLPLP